LIKILPRINTALILSLIFNILISNNAFADWTGYTKSFLSYFESSDNQSQTSFLQIIRLENQFELSENTKFDFAYEWDPAFTSNATSQAKPYRVSDLKTLFHPHDQNTANNKFVIFHNLDRLLLSHEMSWGDLLIGRQPVSFGSARVVNPTDLFAPFSIQTLNQESRQGVDALRLRVPVGELSEWDIGIVFGEHFDLNQSAAYLRYQFNYNLNDFALMTQIYQNHLLLGFDWQRSILDAGFWLESSYTSFFKFDDQVNSSSYLRVSSGMDYHLSSNLYGFFEYHYNGTGNEVYTEASQQGGFYFPQRHVLVPGVQYQITPLFYSSFSLLSLFGLETSLWGSIKFEYQWDEDLYVDLGGFFGSLPRLYYTSLRFYF